MPDMIYFDSKPTPVSRAIHAMRKEGVPEPYITRFLDTAEFAGTFDESKINRASDGKFAPKGSGGSKSADAAEEGRIVTRPKAQESIKSDPLVKGASQRLEKSIDSTEPVKQDEPPQSVGKKILNGLLKGGKFAVKGTALVTSEVLRRGLGVMSFMDMTGIGFMNVPAWLGQDPHFDKMQRKYGRTTANLIAASGYVVQAGVGAIALTAIPHLVAGVIPSLPAMQMVGETLENVQVIMPDKSLRFWPSPKVSDFAFKKVGGYLVPGPVMQGMITAARLSFIPGAVASVLSRASAEDGVLTKVKKALQKLTEYSRKPGEMLAHGAFRELQKMGYDIEIGPDEDPAAKPVKKAKFSRDATFADDDAVTLPLEDIERLGAEFGEYFRQQYVASMEKDPNFWIGFANFMKDEGVTPKMLADFGHYCKNIK